MYFSSPYVQPIQRYDHLYFPLSPPPFCATHANISRFWPSLAGCAARLARPGTWIVHKSIGVTTAERRTRFVSYREDCEKKSEVLTIQVGSAL